MNRLLPHFDKLVHELRLTWLLVKGYNIFNAMFIAWFGMFDPESKVYSYLRHPTSNLDELLLAVLTLAIMFLYTDITLYDKSKEGRRHWKFEKLVPITYMLLGALYLVLAFVASAGGAFGLAFFYVLSAVLTGGSAFATRLRTHWSTDDGR